MLPERIPGRLLEVEGPAFSRAAGDAIDAARLAKSEAIEADARLMEPARPTDPAIAVEHRNTVRALDIGDQARWVEQADLDSLTAVVDGGNRAFLGPETYERARERFWAENWIARHNAHSDHAAAPSTDTVLATGPDMAAVRNQAETYYQMHKDRMAGLADMEAAAKQLIAFMASVFEIAPSEALDRAVGRYDAQAA